MSAAGDRARARNRRELELLARSGAFGPIVEENVDAGAELAALYGVDVDELRVASAAAVADDDERDDGEVRNPPAGASSVDNRTTPLRRVLCERSSGEKPSRWMLSRPYSRSTITQNSDP